GADDRPVSFTAALEAGGLESDGFNLGVQTNIESVGKDVGKVVISLQDVKTGAGRVGNDLIVPVEDGRDNGAKLAQPGEKLLFKLSRLRGKILDAQVDEMSLPELGRAPSPDNGRTLEDAHADACGLQGLGAAESGKAGSNDRNRSRFFHRGNVGRVLKIGQGRGASRF